MNCPHCNSSNTYTRNTTTTLGYHEYPVASVIANLMNEQVRCLILSSIRPK